MIRSTQRRAGRRRGERGTSLLEVTVTAALLAGGVLATVSLLDGTRNANASVDRRATAVELARNAIEAMRAARYDDIGVSPTAPGFVTSFEGRDTVRVNASDFAPSESIERAGTTFTLRRHITWDASRLSSGTLVPESWKRIIAIVEFDDGSRSVRLDGGVSPLAPGTDCVTRATDTAAAPLTGVVNSYLAGSGRTVAGATTVSVLEPYRVGGGSPIRTGDLLLIVQMTSRRGGSAGLFEYAMATSAVSNGRLGVTGAGLGGGLVNSYGSDGRFQVVRVPNYGSVITGPGLAALRWDGRTGGVLALDAVDGITLSAPVSATGSGPTNRVWNGVPRTSSRALLGNGSGGRGGGIVAIRAASFNGPGTVESDGSGRSGGGTVLLTTERNDLSGLTARARGGSGRGEGGSVITNAPTSSADVSGRPAGLVHSTLTGPAIAGVAPGIGCLPAVNVTVETSTPTVARRSGVVLGYWIRVTNLAGRGTAENLTVTDLLPRGFTIRSTTLVRLLGGATRTPVIDPVAGSPTPRWSTFTLPPGGTIEIYLTVTMPAGTRLTRIDNDAIATFSSGGSTFAAAFSGASSTRDDVVIVR